MMVNLYRVTRSLLAGRISEKTAGLMLWSVAIGMPGARRLRKPAQPQRTRRKTLPGINADERRSGKKVSRESTRMNTNAQIHAGVTNDKSFVSGVEGWVPPGVRTRQSGENALTRHGRVKHSRDLSTPPRVAGATSDSLKMTKGEGRLNSSEHRDAGIESNSSVSLRLRSENGLSNHKGHEGSRRSASKEIAREEQSSGSDSIRVDPRQSAVSSCSSSVSPCLRGGIDSSRAEVLPHPERRFSLEEPRGSKGSGSRAEVQR